MIEALVNQEPIGIDLTDQIVSVNIDPAPALIVEMLGDQTIEVDAASQQLIDLEVAMPVLYQQGSAPISPTLNYTNGLLTSIVYSDGQTKTLTYSGGVLTQLDFYNLINTTRKTFNYSSGVLTSVTQVTL